MSLKIRVLGSGTSSGVPTIGCTCAVCKSSDPRDRRLRPSILIQHGERNIVIDTTPDFRAQVLQAGIDRLDAVVYTHAHADHILGMDDVRPFNFHQKARIPIYASPSTFAVIERIFDYVFDPRERNTSIPKIEVNLIGESPFNVAGLSFEPIPILHGEATVLGFRVGNAAYLTDHSAIPESSMRRLEGLDVLFLDALRHKPHPTHSTVETSIATAQALRPRRTFFTHICHDLPHAATEASLPPGIFLAYDGLEIEVADPGMKIFHSPEEVPADFGPSVVTIGNFDGVHEGHREIMRRVVSIANRRGLTSTVLTFDPHPARVLAPNRAPKLIATVPQRLRRLAKESIEAVLLLPFSLEFATLSPEDFVEQILVRILKARCVLVGEDFRFGYRQSGNIETLRTLGERYGFDLEPVPAISGRGERISSTRIRNLVMAGLVSKACRIMGAPFALEGRVVGGQGIGSKKTVPTLNLAPENELLPKTGVYVTRTRDESTGRQWRSITNVGYRPTFAGENLTVETFLLDPPPALSNSTDAAPERIEVEFLTFVRAERKFASPELLRAQILRDVGAAQRFHRRVERLRVG